MPTFRAKKQSQSVKKALLQALASCSTAFAAPSCAPSELAESLKDFYNESLESSQMLDRNMLRYRPNIIPWSCLTTLSPFIHAFPKEHFSHRCEHRGTREGKKHGTALPVRMHCLVLALWIWRRQLRQLLFGKFRLSNRGILIALGSGMVTCYAFVYA